MSKLLSLLAFPILAIACAAPTATESVEEDGPLTDEERALLADPEIGQSSDELGARPKYTTRSVAVRGEFTTNETCPGGFEACERILVKKTETGLSFELGYWDSMFGEYDGYRLKAWSKNGVILFVNDGPIHDDCQDPGCGDMMKITGVIYPVRQGNEWVPQIKATFTTEFDHPDEVDAPSGEVTTTVRMRKSAQ
jgi:hypothetical protein